MNITDIEFYKRVLESINDLKLRDKISEICKARKILKKNKVIKDLERPITEDEIDKTNTIRLAISTGCGYYFIPATEYNIKSRWLKKNLKLFSKEEYKYYSDMIENVKTKTK